MVLVDGDLAGDDITVALEHALKAFGVDVFGDLSYEEVLLHEAGHVGAEEVSLVGEGSAGLAFELEVAELLGNLDELVGVVDLDHGSVEGLAGVTANLGHVLEVVASEVLDDLGKTSGSVVLAAEVIQVDDVGVGELFLTLLHPFLSSKVGNKIVIVLIIQFFYEI